MLRHLRENGRGWSGQLLFANGGLFRDPHIVYGFLDQHADRVVDTASRIAADPRMGEIAVREWTDRPRGGVLVGPTLSLLKRRPRDPLEKNPQGEIAHAGHRYSPRKVVARRSQSTTDTGEHRRLAWLLQTLQTLTLEVSGSHRRMALDVADRTRTEWCEAPGQKAR
jgi:hypothetical protein